MQRLATDEEFDCEIEQQHDEAATDALGILGDLLALLGLIAFMLAMLFYVAGH